MTASTKYLGGRPLATILLATALSATTLAPERAMAVEAGDVSAAIQNENIVAVPAETASASDSLRNSGAGRATRISAGSAAHASHSPLPPRKPVIPGAEADAALPVAEPAPPAAPVPRQRIAGTSLMRTGPIVEPSKPSVYVVVHGAAFPQTDAVNPFSFPVTQTDGEIDAVLRGLWKRNKVDGRWRGMVADVRDVLEKEGVEKAIARADAIIDGAFRWFDDPAIEGNWETPSTALRMGYGVCREFATSKALLLVHAGVILPRDYRIAWVTPRDPSGASNHIVLIVRYRKGDGEHQVALDMYDAKKDKVQRFGSLIPWAEYQEKDRGLIWVGNEQGGTMLRRSLPSHLSRYRVAYRSLSQPLSNDDGETRTPVKRGRSISEFVTIDGKTFEVVHTPGDFVRYRLAADQSAGRPNR